MTIHFFYSKFACGKLGGRCVTFH